MLLWDRCSERSIEGIANVPMQCRVRWRYHSSVRGRLGGTRQTPTIRFVFGELENTDGVHRHPLKGEVGAVSSRLGSKLPLPQTLC